MDFFRLSTSFGFLVLVASVVSGQDSVMPDEANEKLA